MCVTSATSPVKLAPASARVLAPHAFNQARYLTGHTPSSSIASVSMPVQLVMCSSIMLAFKTALLMNTHLEDSATVS